MNKVIARWLWLCAALVFLMAVVGAVTRLTESGLSIAEWKPLMGAIPPLSQAEWDRVFALYQQTPQYKEVNTGMTLEAFKGIFWWEWGHRFLGRMIGLVFALPLLWFAVTRHIAGKRLWQMFGLLTLGGLQGAVGWFMVASGLVDNPAVSHYRLALHLSLAVLLMCLLIRMALEVGEVRPDYAMPLAPRGLRSHVKLSLFMVAITMIWGAFVAGLDAGLIYNEFPMMGAGLFPAEGLHLRPLWHNFIENHATVQFTHRWLAMLTAIVVFALGVDLRSSPNVSLRASQLGLVLIIIVAIQVGLGISTLLFHVPTLLAASHQAGHFL